MSSIQELEDMVFEIAKRHGWVVEDLNDNPHGVRVTGKSWKARLNAETPFFGWDREDIAEQLAHWILHSAGEE